MLNAQKWHQFVKFFSHQLQLQSLPSCSINLPASLQNLPKFCAPWSSWCEESSSSETQQEEEITGNYSSTTAASINDQPVAAITQTSFHVPPKYPAKYYQRKMPFRRKNWCGCLQVSQNSIKLWKYTDDDDDDDSAEALQSIL